jgi:hypothetical protein
MGKPSCHNYGIAERHELLALPREAIKKKEQ